MNLPFSFVLKFIRAPLWQSSQEKDRWRGWKWGWVKGGGRDWNGVGREKEEGGGVKTVFKLVTLEDQDEKRAKHSGPPTLLQLPPTTPCLAHHFKQPLRGYAPVLILMERLMETWKEGNWRKIKGKFSHSPSLSFLLVHLRSSSNLACACQKGEEDQVWKQRNALNLYILLLFII